MNINEITKLKQTEDLFKKLITDSKSIFYAIDKVSKTLLSKARISFYPKDKVFIKLDKYFNNKNILYPDDKNNTKLSFC